MKWFFSGLGNISMLELCVFNPSLVWSLGCEGFSQFGALFALKAINSKRCKIFATFVNLTDFQLKFQSLHYLYVHTTILMIMSSTVHLEKNDTRSQISWTFATCPSYYCWYWTRFVGVIWQCNSRPVFWRHAACLYTASQKNWTFLHFSIIFTNAVQF